MASDVVSDVAGADALPDAAGADAASNAAEAVGPMTGSVSRAAGGTASGAEIWTVTPGGAVGTGSPHLIVSIGARSVSRSNRSSTEMASSDRLTSVKVSRSPSASTVRSRRSQTVGSALGTPTPRRIPMNCSVDALVTPCPIGSGSAPSTVTTARANTRTSAHKTPCVPEPRSCPSGAERQTVGARSVTARSCSRGCRGAMA